MKIITIAMEYNGEGESWEEIKDDAKNNKIKNIFIGSKEFVNVVRCKDCKYRYKMACHKAEFYECSHIGLTSETGNITHVGVTDDFFCADGERREDWIRNPKYPHGELRDHLIDEMLDKEERNGIQ